MDIKICKRKIRPYICELRRPEPGNFQPISRIFWRSAVPGGYGNLMLALLLCSCQLQKESEHDGLIMALASNPTQLDPRFAVDAFSEKIGGLVFGSLLRRNPAGLLEPEIAQSLLQPDPLTLVVTLKPGQYFSDGRQLTAADVKATFDFVRTPENGAPRQGSLKAITAIETPNPQTVIFHLSRPYAPFRETLTLGILPEALARQKSPAAGHLDALVGSGPYTLTHLVRDERVTLEANPYHQPAPATPRLTFKIVPDASVRALELLHGSVDLLQNDLPAYLVSWLAAQPGIREARHTSTMTRYLTLNPQSPPLNQGLVRKAIAHAIDPSTLVRTRLRGLGTPARSLLPMASFAYRRDLPGYPYNPALARTLLDQAGFPDPPGPAPRFSLLYKTSQDETGAAVARIFQSQLREIGIAVTVQTNEWGIFFGDITRGNFQLYCLTAVGVNDPDYLAFLFASDRIPPNGGNRARYSAPAMDEALHCGQTRLEPAERRDCYAKAQELAQEAAVYLPLWYEENVALMRDTIEGYQVTPGGDFQSLARTRRRAPAP